MERRDAEMNPARMQTRLFFSTACQMRFENLPTEEKQRPLNLSPSPIDTHSNTAQRTHEVPLRLVLLSRRVFSPEIGVHCYVNGNRQSRLQHLRRHLRM